MKAYRKFLFRLILLFGVILLFSCKKEEIEPLHPIEDNEIDLPVLYVEKGSDIIIDHDIYIDSAILFIDEGVNMRFKNGARIIVGDNWPATILAIGKEDNPINFIPYSDGSQEDEYWGGIQILSSSKYISTFDHCNFIKGCDDDNDAILYQERGYISIKNCLFDYSKKYGVYISRDSHIEDFTNNVIKHTFEHPLVISSLLVHKIGDNNLFLTDKKNKGILLGSLGSKDDELQVSSEDDDTIVWKAQTVPYIFKGGLGFSYGNVKICAGTVLAMENPYGYGNCYINISCNHFEAAGTAEKPVIFTSNELNKKPADWDRIEIGSRAIFNNCIFEYGGGHYVPNYLNQCMIRVDEKSHVSFDSCIFRYSETDAIGIKGEHGYFPSILDFSNNTFSNLQRFAVSMYIESISSLGENNNFNNYLIHLRSLNITKQYTYWKNPGGAFYIDNYIKLNNNYAKLEFGPGVVLKFDNGGIIIGDSKTGTLICNGTEDEPIIFTSAKENPERGDWKGISFGSGSTDDCVLDHCKVLYAGKVGYCPANISAGNQVTIKNSTIAHSLHWGISYFEAYEPTLENNTFFDNLDGDICSSENK